MTPLTFRRALAFLFLLLSSPSFGVAVNRLNGSATLIYVDFSIPGRVIPLELVRTYNTLTALNETTGWNGAFGWGWTSPFESTLIVTPQQHVILRDGQSGNTVLFKPITEDPKMKAAYFEAVRQAYFERSLSRKMTPEENRKLALPEKMVMRLKSDPQFRNELAVKFNLTAPVPKGQTLVSSEYGYQTLEFKNNQWVREKDGVTQTFDPQGRMIRQADRTGFFLDFKYDKGSKGKLSEISDADRAMSLKFTWRADRIIEVTDNRSIKARYTYDGSGNLIQVIDSNTQTFFFRYENKKFPHLLTKIEYPGEVLAGNKAFRELRYDDNGLAVYHRDKDGSESSYVYGKGSDPENNFSTKVVRKTKAGATETFDDYTLKAKADGTKYLYKNEHRENGTTTVTIYNPCCGKPLQITKNGETTNFKYNESGMLVEKVGPKEELYLEYDGRWKKVSKVKQGGVTSSYEYDDVGNLVKASNSRNENVALKYDKYGRITEMTNAESRNIQFRYGDNGKPILIEEKGVGLIRIDYDNEGKVKKTVTIVSSEKGRAPSQAKSQEVVKRVMKGFQQLLDIIRPAGAGVGAIQG